MNILFPIFALVALILLGLFLLHRGFRAPGHDDLRTPRDIGLAFDSQWIESVAGRQLAAWWIAASEPVGNAVVIHGWGSGKAQMLELAKPLNRLGLNLLMIDARNHGNSDRHTFSSMPRFAEDVGRSIDWLRETRPDVAHLPLVLVGHSVGAGAVLLEASRRTDVSAVISLSAFAHPEEVMQRYLASLRLPRMLLRGVLEYVQWLIGHRFDDIAPLNTIALRQAPVLIVHGDRDTTVPLRDAERLNKAAGDGATFLVVAGAGHDYLRGIGDLEIAELASFLTPLLTQAPSSEPLCLPEQ